MKKIILIILLAVFTFNADAVLRVKNIDQTLGQITVQNYASIAYSYDLFVIAVGVQYYVLSAILISGTLTGMTPGATAVIGLTIPPGFAAGESISIWYPGSLPSNATPINLVDFLQYGSAGNAYESVAVTAGTWTLGDFISVPFPINFNGGISDYGINFYGTFVGIDNPNTANDISIYPNPCVDYSIIDIPQEIVIDESIVAEIYNAEGKLIEVTDKISDPLFNVNTSKLQTGFYFIRLMNAAVEVKTLRLVKQ